MSWLAGFYAAQRASLRAYLRRKYGPDTALGDLGWTEVDERGLALLKSVVREQTAAALRAAAAGMARKS